MPLKKYVQTPGERKRYTINYSEWLDTGEALISVVFTPPGGGVAPLVVDDVMITPDTLGVQYYVSGGDDGSQYEVLVTATTGTGQIKEDTVLFTVRDAA